MTSDATHVASGKVRDGAVRHARAGRRADRISTFDVVLPTHPGQGAGADRARRSGLRERARSCRTTPRAPRGRANDGLPEARDARSSASCAGISLDPMERLSGDWSGFWSRPAGRARRVGAPARAYLHACDEGEGGSRPEHRRGGSSGAVRRRPVQRCEASIARSVSIRVGSCRGVRDHRGRHEVRARARCRGDRARRRGAHTRLVTVLAGRQLPTRRASAVVRQAVRPRLVRAVGVGQDTAWA